MDFNDVFANGFESSVNKLQRRKCVECPHEMPVCPKCGPNEACTQIPRSCLHCESRTCKPMRQVGLLPQPAAPSPSRGPNIGAIVGGVVGGVVFIALATYLVWHFCIKSRRQQWEDEIDQEFKAYTEKRSSGGYVPGPHPDSAAASLRPRQSVASTTYTRGSNVIQIAFIPGITDRAGEAAGFVPPVPPIPSAVPGAQSPRSLYSNLNQDHYFMPGDLRDSAYSGFTDDGASTLHRQSMAPSIAPSLLRQSIASSATTMYRGESIVDTGAAAAQTAQRGRPLMVSVKTPGSSATPPVPLLDRTKYTQAAQLSPLSQQLPSPSTSSATAKAPAGKVATPTTSIPTVRTQHLGDKLPKVATPSTDEDDIRSAIEQAARNASKQPIDGTVSSIQREASPFSDDNRIG